MNSIERIKASVNFETPDRTPVIAQVFGHAAVLANVPLGKYVQDGELLARCQIKALESYGYDAVFALMDVNVETEAVGSVLSYREYQYPYVQSYAFTKRSNLENIPIPDPHESGRMPELLKAASLLRHEVGDALGIPTYATVIIGNSAVASDQTIKEILSHATSLNCDGFYYGFEFSSERIPSSREIVLRCCTGGLTLACTGLPVLHAFAGPMALLSLGFGAKGSAIGHFKNLWQFTRSRWGPTPDQGGGGNAPPRFFSSSLWGTIICPDEIIQLPPTLQNQILTHSPFSSQVSSSRSFSGWPVWDAGKHMVHTICSEVSDIASNDDIRTNANNAITLLQGAVTLHTAIASTGLTLRDDTNSYQENWQLAMNDLLTNNSRDFDYLDLLS